MNRDRFHLFSTRLGLALCLAGAAACRAAAADLPPGLVLHYSFDQAPVAASGAIADQSALHNDGRATGTRWTATGKQGGALDFGASNECITVANSGSLNLKKMTIAVWFKTAKSDAVQRRIVDKRAGRGYALGIAGDYKSTQSRGRLLFTVNGRYFCSSDNVLTDGAWHHAAAVCDGKELSLYVDGLVQKSVTDCPEEVAANLDDLTIGMNKTNPDVQERGKSFDGTLDDLMIFNRALAADELKSLVSAVDPAFGKQKFTKQQVAGRLQQLKLLHEEGLLTEKFYSEKVAECEAAVEASQTAATTNAPAKPAK